MTRYFAAQALLPEGLARDVALEIEAGRFVSVVPDSEPIAAHRLPGVVIPGLANAHSHAFHRALRGHETLGAGSFWSWRPAMYDIARRLDPDTYLALARATYAEMALAGITSVGEFHYLHHAPGGHRYDNPNAMGEALRQAASDAGIRLTLLDTCYLRGALDGAGYQSLDEVQQQFSDGNADAWHSRMSALSDSATFRLGAAIHSVRAVPRDGIATIAAAIDTRMPLHVHVSEQPAENQACQSFYGCSPTQLLNDAGAVRGSTTAVHATHLSPDDIDIFGAVHATVCFCPSTERDLGDGIGPATELLAAGALLSLGSDQHVIIDLLEEARLLEGHERLRTLSRGCFASDQLLTAMTAHPSIGWPDAGTIAVGSRADLVCLRNDSVRVAGVSPEQLAMVATTADVDTVIVDGVPIVVDGGHRLGDVAQLLSDALGALRG